jgi:TolB protein
MAPAGIGSARARASTRRFSPNGKKIVYGASDGQIHVMNEDGTHDHALTSVGGDYPDWSPNGRLIGYSSSSSGSSQVWIMRADGTHKHQVTTAGADYSPVFSPDGAFIAYTTGSGGSPIWVSRLDGSHKHQVVASQGACCIGWQPLP